MTAYKCGHLIHSDCLFKAIGSNEKKLKKQCPFEICKNPVENFNKLKSFEIKNEVDKQATFRK